VEFPDPYSNTVFSEKSSWDRYVIAGYVYQGVGFPSPSIGTCARDDAACP
jgi:hypothetical protein